MASSLPKPLATTYHWFFTDIVSATGPSTTADEQALKIVDLNNLIRATDIFAKISPVSAKILPTGDGVAIGFKNNPEKPFLLAKQLHELLVSYNDEKGDKDRLSIRVGLNTGPVYDIKDLIGNRNVWGPGIVTARRVMDLARGMNILASEGFADDIRKLKKDYKKYLHSIGKYQIKHNEQINIYNIYGDGIGNSKAPPKPSEVESKVVVENPVLFTGIELILDIIDPKTMLTHHTAIWKFVNVSDHEIDRLFYNIGGDFGTPRDFEDLHVVVKDESGRRLHILSVDENKPYYKEFFVLLRKKINSGRKGTATMQYDWEEKDRRFGYTFASDCKNFKFVLRVPKDLGINQRVVRKNMGTGEKIRAALPPIVRSNKKWKEVTWSANKLRAHEVYRFDW
jgi:hypothetical protein